MTTTLTAPSTRLQPLQSQRPPKKVAIVSTFPPRQCGIGAYTQEMYKCLVEAGPEFDVQICAVDRDGLRYGAEVETVLDQDDQAAYRKAAAGLATEGVDVVLIQHEFGIYGGPDGGWITSFAAELSAKGVPYLVTLHNVPESPTRGQVAVLRRLCRDAATVTVFTPTARRLAASAGVRVDRFEVVPQGAPAALRSRGGMRSPRTIRPPIAEMLSEVEDAIVVSTFGLLSVDKGLQTAIYAVADLARDLPDLCYIIAGATHPEVLRREGEDYRQSLRELVEELGAGDHIRFMNCFLSDSELAALLSRTTVFLTPYRARDQVSSGTLTYALAAGCPVVSTSFFYAQDMLSSGAGLLAEPGDTAGYTAALRRMLIEPGRLSKATSAAWQRGATVVWPAVAPRVVDAIRAATAAEAKQNPPIVVPYQR